MLKFRNEVGNRSDFNLYGSAKNKKRKKYSSIQGKIVHYRPDCTGRDMYIFNTHGGLTKNVKKNKKHFYSQYTNSLRDNVKPKKVRF